MNRLILCALCVSASFGAGKAECADGSCQGKAGSDSHVLLQANVQHDVVEEEGIEGIIQDPIESRGASALPSGASSLADDDDEEVKNTISEIETWGMETEDMDQVRALLNKSTKKWTGRRRCCFKGKCPSKPSCYR